MKKLTRIKKTPIANFSNEAEVQEFMHDLFGNLTVISVGNEIWFIGKEVAEKLGYKNSRKAIKDHCKYVKLFRSNESSLLKLPFEVNPMGIQIINEKDLYRLIMRSRLPNAEIFQDWVTDEVLPAIRKTGSYSFEVKPKTKLELLEAYYKAEKKMIQLEEKIQNDKPLVNFANQVTDSSDSIDFETFAKLVKDQHIPIGRNRLYKWLRIHKFIMDNNLPYQHALEKGFFTVVETTYNTYFGIRLSSRTMITPIGQIYFCNRLQKEFITQK